jgi:hypothetical protein
VSYGRTHLSNQVSSFFPRLKPDLLQKVQAGQGCGTGILASFKIGYVKDTIFGIPSNNSFPAIVTFICGNMDIRSRELQFEFM